MNTINEEQWIVNPHWDKVLKIRHNLSDDVLQTIKQLLYDSDQNFAKLYEENRLLKKQNRRISDMLAKHI